jgi:beta-phosphoglucomutase-like phosphatase (HAD superfamily)
MSAEGLSPSGRPIQTVLETLKIKIDLDQFDAAVFELETVVADLGYGDVRPLSASVAWIDHLRDEGKRIALVDGGVRGESVLALAGLGDRFDLSAATSEAALDELGVEADRSISVAASVECVMEAKRRGAHLVIAVARGLATPEQLRRAGADTVVAELHELL